MQLQVLQLDICVSQSIYIAYIFKLRGDFYMTSLIFTDLCVYKTLDINSLIVLSYST